MADARKFTVGTKFDLAGWEDMWWVVVSQDPLKVKRRGKGMVRRVDNSRFWKRAEIIEPVSKEDHVANLKEKYGI